MGARAEAARAAGGRVQGEDAVVGWVAAREGGLGRWGG